MMTTVEVAEYSGASLRQVQVWSDTFQLRSTVQQHQRLYTLSQARKARCLYRAKQIAGNGLRLRYTSDSLFNYRYILFAARPNKPHYSDMRCFGPVAATNSKARVISISAEMNSAVVLIDME